MHGLDKNDPRLTTLIVQAEHRLPEAEGEPPAESSARCRKTGVPKALALAVLAGIVAFVVGLIFASP